MAEKSDKSFMDTMAKFGYADIIELIAMVLGVYLIVFGLVDMVQALNAEITIILPIPPWVATAKVDAGDVFMNGFAYWIVYLVAGIMLILPKLTAKVGMKLAKVTKIITPLDEKDSKMVVYMVVWVILLALMVMPYDVPKTMGFSDILFTWANFWKLGLPFVIMTIVCMKNLLIKR